MHACLCFISTMQCIIHLLNPYRWITEKRFSLGWSRFDIETPALLMFVSFRSADLMSSQYSGGWWYCLFSWSRNSGLQFFFLTWFSFPAAAFPLLLLHQLAYQAAWEENSVTWSEVSEILKTSDMASIWIGGGDFPDMKTYKRMEGESCAFSSSQ